ncbi:hypothetical protein ACFL5G_05720 [Candidatus Margulisiibacteriota bacterium]
MDSDKLTAFDIVEIAIEMEKKGADLYHELAQAARQMPIADVFKKLEEEKAKHLEQYQKLLKKVSKEAPQEAYPGEYILYLRNLAEEHVLSKEEAKKEFAAVNTPKEALDIALNYKKNTLLYLKELEQALSGKDDKIVKELIKKKQQDLNHLLELKKKSK